MHKRTDMSPLLITTKRLEWVFCMPYTVRRETSGLLSAALTSNRTRSVLCTVGLDPVLHHETLVFPLPLLVRHRDHQRSSSNNCISFQNSSRYFPFLSQHSKLDWVRCRMLARDRATAGRGGGWRTQRISSNFSSACGKFNGIVHPDICRVCFLLTVHDSR